ncbi:MAG: type I restriction enzyme HsdR N-terminal domain-containing protein [Anaerolineae bacterium]|nr:type I restriction enzyme HsdR N-terminal domain-containing protein [Anaerolineae bacterium]
MDFIERLKEIADRIPQQREYIRTEEATKSALVMPFIQALGYNVFDPSEVTPEYVADFGTKKGEKVDYVLLKDRNPIVMFECKTLGTNLDNVSPTQLFRYFSVSPVRFGILTNGINYRIFSDLDEPNKMDSKPFLELDLLDLDDPITAPVIEEIKKFTKESFDVNHILLSASDFKYTRQIKLILASQLQAPTDDFVKYFGNQLYTGRITLAQKDQIARCIRRAFNQYVSEQINSRLKAALITDTSTPSESTVASPTPETVSAEITAAAVSAATTPPDGTATPLVDRQIVTTAEEVEAYYVIKALLRDTVELKRIVMRDSLSYCAILLDDNNRKPICRLYFNNALKKSIVFLDVNRQEERVYIERIDDIYKLADKLKLSIGNYLGTSNVSQ